MERTGNQYVRGGEYRLDIFGTKIGKADEDGADGHKADRWTKTFKDI